MGGTGQPVEFPDGDDVALAKLVEHPVQPRPVAVGPGDLLVEDALTRLRCQADRRIGCNYGHVS